MEYQKPEKISLLARKFIIKVKYFLMKGTFNNRESTLKQNYCVERKNITPKLQDLKNLSSLNVKIV